MRAPSANRMIASIQYARMLAASGLLPREYRNAPANVLYAVEYGAMLNLPPIAAITGINIIEGKPTASAGLISSLVRRAGHRLRVGFDEQTMTGWATINRADDPDFTFRCEWNLDRAVTAELCSLKDGKPYAIDSKGRSLPWRKFYPSMTKRRAITEVARDACEEVLYGVHYTPEEMTAETDDDGNVIMAAAPDPADIAGNPWDAAQPAQPARANRPSGANAWMDWAIEHATSWTTYEERDKLRDRTAAKQQEGKITPEQAGLIEGAIKEREAVLVPPPGPVDLSDPAGPSEPVEAEIPKPAPLADGDEWAETIAGLLTQDDCDRAETEVFELCKRRKMAEVRGDLITAHIRARATEIAQASA